MYRSASGLCGSRAERHRSRRHGMRVGARAAAAGDATAQCNRGCMYKNGDGVDQSDEQAVGWFEKAAKQGLAEAQTYLGMMYESGEGVDQCFRQAREWYEEAAAQGSKTALYNLGCMYENGDGVLSLAEFREAVAVHNGHRLPGGGGGGGEGQGEIPPEELATIFARADADGNARVLFVSEDPPCRYGGPCLHRCSSTKRRQSSRARAASTLPNAADATALADATAVEEGAWDRLSKLSSTFCTSQSHCGAGKQLTG